MELYFNELSIQNKKLSVDNLLEMLKIKKFVSSFKITVCRIYGEDYARILSFLNNNENNDSRILNLRNGLLSFLQPPYEREDLLDTQINSFLEDEWKYEDKQCVGLAWAAVFESFALSYFTPEWDKNFLRIICGENTFIVSNFCNAKHCGALQTKLESLQEVELRKTDVKPENKEISLRDDHGKDILCRFSKKIIGDEYIIGIINSLPYQSKERNFIHNIKQNGIIEIVLTHTDKGLGIVVQTTGQNMRETEAIAKILEEQYGGV